MSNHLVGWRKRLTSSEHVILSTWLLKAFSTVAILGGGGGGGWIKGDTNISKVCAHSERFTPSPDYLVTNLLNTVLFKA